MAQRVLVTAGASGIGLSIVRAFAEADPSNRIHICDINEEAGLAVTNQLSAVTFTKADVCKEEDVRRLFDDVERELGGLDVLVNNAGIAGETAPVESYRPQVFRQVLDVNVMGNFLVAQAAIPLLKRSSSGSILTMSSLAGRFGYANRSAYSASKWALVGFAKTLALELGPFGITSNSIHPGATQGERFTNVLKDRAASAGTTVEEQMQLALRNQSIQRVTEPDDIAALVMFLTGPHARTISGQVFAMDGDSKAAS